jgi:hypothetical protein
MKNTTSAIAAFVQSAPAAAAVVTKPATTKAKPRTTRKAATAPKAASPLKGIKFYPTIARPGAGASLYAFTQAWLELTGMLNAGAQIDRAALSKIIGDTAIAYHKKLNNFFVKEKTVHLTQQGSDFFSERMITGKVDATDVDAWKEIMITGKPDGMRVKSANHLAKFAA